LDRQPAAELIPGTLAMWVKVITNRRVRVFEQQRDAPRFQQAFLKLAEGRAWPVPQDFLDALPAPEKPRAVLRIDSEAQRERNKARLKQLLADIGIESSRRDADESVNDR
jgi:hypothetical protein